MQILTEDSGLIRITLTLLDTGNGLICALTGGEKPHVGGIALAAPRPSLTGSGRSADVTIVPVSGHLDTEVASPMARRLCIALGAPVSVTAGVHMDCADRATIETVLTLCERLTARAETLVNEGGLGECHL